jgi:hypothetical protein
VTAAVLLSEGCAVPKKGLGRGGFGPGFFIILAVVLYVLWSGVMAISTADNCGQLRAEKHWVYFPPKWECDS